jgi:thioesterase domain-containing protein
MTLAGWGLIVLKLRSLGRKCDVFVQDSTIRYLAPVWTDFAAEANLADGESWDSFLGLLDERGRSRLRVVCRVPLAAGGDAVTFEARFVALTAKPAST